MPSLDSLSFALLIPFTICFILIFVVCCFAEKIKEICRLPNPIPTNYIAIEHGHRHQPRAQSRRHLGVRSHDEDNRILIINEETRSRNVSESSTDSNLTRALVRITPSVVQQHGPNNAVITLPQTVLSMQDTAGRTNRTIGVLTRNNSGIYLERNNNNAFTERNNNTIYTERNNNNNSSFSLFRNIPVTNCNNHINNDNIITISNESDSRQSINRNRSVPEFLSPHAGVHTPRSNSSNALRNLPEIIPRGLNTDKKV